MQNLAYTEAWRLGFVQPCIMSYLIYECVAHKESQLLEHKNVRGNSKVSYWCSSSERHEHLVTAAAYVLKSCADACLWHIGQTRTRVLRDRTLLCF
jgi:hypothetical protein